MMNSLKVIFVFVVILAGAYATDYCKSSLCPSGKKHIACGHNGKFASSCPSNAKMVNLSPHITTILHLHNTNRNLIAGGGLNGYKAATRMATMQWDNELASLAALNVKQCQMKHDACRNTDTFKYSGQNLAYMYYSGAETRFTDDFLIRNRVQAWFEEYKVCKMAYINKYPNNYSGPAIGHFTVMVADRNNRVGCAASRYTNSNGHYFLIACNYATTNLIGQSIYTAGAAGSGCTKGKNSAYKNLCAAAEEYKN